MKLLEVSLVRKRVRKVMQVDAGVIEVELDEEEEAPRHTKGPLRPLFSWICRASSSLR